MNKNIFNTAARRLAFTGQGKETDGNVYMPLVTDSSGRIILSPEITVDGAANGLNIRPLQWAADSVTATAANLDVRSLTAARDGLSVFGNADTVTYESAAVGILTTRYFLVTNTAPYSRWAFYVSNTSGITVGATITLQAAPADINDYYTNDGSDFSLLGGNRLILQPTALLKFARVRVTTLLALATIEVYFFGQA